MTMPLPTFDDHPLVVIWETTRACQLACRHCRASAIRHRNPAELIADEVGEYILRPLSTMGRPIFVLTGGDPMERDDLAQIVATANGAGLHPSITPSATPKLTLGRLKELKDAGIQSCALSLDGSSAPIHDRFRGIVGTFDLTMEKIGWLHQLKIPLQIHTTVSLFNLDDLTRIADLVRQLGVFRWSVFFLIPVGRARSKDMLSPIQQEEVLQWLWMLQEAVPFQIKTTEAPQLGRIQAQHGAVRVSSRSAVWDGNGFLFISHLGDIYPSGFLPIRLGNVRQDSLASIYREHPVLLSLRNPEDFRGKCGYCEFNRVCGGSRARAWALTDDFLESDPFCPYIPDPRTRTLGGSASVAGR